MIPSWSFSRIQDFAACKHRAFLKYVKKIPEPERVLMPGKTEFANDRGTRLHDNVEGYVRGDHDALAPEVDKHFGWQIELLRVMYADGLVDLEGEWGMDRDWNIAEWSKAWLRLKLDALVMLSPEHALVIDYKSGKKYGNEVKHAQQLMLYQAVTFLRYPMLEKVTAELWYFDLNQVTSQNYVRSGGLKLKDNFHKQGVAMTTCTDFPANPNIHSCQYCPYKNTEHCLVGVSK